MYYRLPTHDKELWECFCLIALHQAGLGDEFWNAIQDCKRDVLKAAQIGRDAGEIVANIIVQPGAKEYILELLDSYGVMTYPEYAAILPPPPR